MDEARQQRPHSDAPSIPLEVLSGLGIDISSANMSSQEVDDDTTSHRKTTPDSAQHFVSPPSTGGLSGSTQVGQSPANFFNPDASKPFSRHSTSYSASLAHQSLPEDPQASLLRKHHSASLYSAYGDFTANHKCESMKDVKGSRRNWLSTVTILLTLYSTILSGMFVIIALRRPRWEMIGTHGRLTPSSAALLTTILAKTIEMSFVTVIIAMIGQDLSRRASSTRRRSGVTLAELNMRNWIMQPGTMISRWESVRYAGISFLGLVSFAAAVCAMLYTPACAALVQPQLRLSSWEQRNMSGLVQTKFANPHHIQKQCFTPLPEGEDETERWSTCLSIEHAAMAYKNYFTYLGIWSEKDASSNFTDRPNGTAWFSNDTTVVAPWVGVKHDAAFLYPGTDIIVNNVSIAFPHTGVATAARDPNNTIAQPEDLDGVGRYTINASVASPLLHSLCATVSENHLAPLIFEKWRLTNETLNHTSWPAQLQFTDTHPSPYLGGTSLDDIFEWGEKYGDYSWPPVFMRLPQAFNTMVNGTGGDGQSYGRSSVYILGKGNSTDSGEDPAACLDYFLCQLQVSQTPYCYTSYQASGQGAVLEAACDDSPPSGHTMRYIEGEKNAPSSRVFADRDWANVASEMALALSQELQCQATLPTPPPSANTRSRETIPSRSSCRNVRMHTPAVDPRRAIHPLLEVQRVNLNTGRTPPRRRRIFQRVHQRAELRFRRHIKVSERLPPGPPRRLCPQRPSPGVLRHAQDVVRRPFGAAEPLLARCQFAAQRCVLRVLWHRAHGQRLRGVVDAGSGSGARFRAQWAQA
jgi:hypothetical protein